MKNPNPWQPEDFEPAADVFLAHLQRFQEKGTVTRDDILGMMADVFNCMEEIEERRAEREAEEAPLGKITNQTLVYRVTSSASTW